MAISIGLLVLSIVGIVALFALKMREEKTGHVLAPSLRNKADERALELKSLLMRAQAEAEKMPSLSVAFARLVVHDTALGFAKIASLLELQAHNLADFVSHKHRFERREPRNEFLKRVGEPKNGAAFDAN